MKKENIVYVDSTLELEDIADIIFLILLLFLMQSKQWRFQRGSFNCCDRTNSTIIRPTVWDTDDLERIQRDLSLYF
jgi:hypothetical protein